MTAPTRPPRRACVDCPKRALPGSPWCNECEPDLTPEQLAVPSNPTTPGGVR